MALPAKKRFFLIGFTLGIILAGGFMVLSPFVSATTSYSIEDIGTSVGLGTVDLKNAIINIIKWVLGIVSLVAVSFLIYGGVLWMTARGNEEKLAKAKKTIINAVIGIIIILLSWAIVMFVQRTFTNATTGGGCTPGERRDISPGDQCLICNADGQTWRLDIANPACTSPGGVEEFRVNDFATANENGIVNEDLYTCSAIGSIFNNRVKKSTVTAVENTNLKVEELTCSISGATCLTDAECAALGGGTCDATQVDGNWPTGSKSLTYKHLKVCSNDATQECTGDAECGGDADTCDIVLFNEDIHYRLTLPKSITDLNDLALSRANFLFCDDTDAANITCTFTTGDQNDIVAPYVTTTYPVHDGDAGYPDLNVSRQPIINVNFSESIDPTTVVDLNNSPQPNPNNIMLQRLDAQGGTPQAGGDLDTDNDTYIDANFLQVEEKSAGFLLSLVPPDALESFAWYRLTVQNVEDMCGNAMDPMPTLEFQTNDKIAGFRSWYPKGENECPDVQIAATFNTSMYYHRVQFVLSDLDTGSSQSIVLDAPDVTGTSSITSALGTLQIMNADFSNPSKNFTRYELRPANPLIPNHHYQVFVYTDRVIDSAGTLLQTDWTFAVATAEDCTCAPQITELDPDQGGLGECISIKGYCFTGTTNHTAVPDRVLFDTVNANIESYGKNYIVTTTPAGFGGPYPQIAPVTVRIDYDEATYGQVESDPFDYTYTSNTEATGPCLFSESHSSCYPGSAVTLRGIRFKDAADTIVKQVTFADGALSGTVNSWADTVITTNVPATTEENNDDGDINVTNDVGTSNGIYFDICQPPPGVPIVTKYLPNCGTACINTLPTVEFNKVEMDAGTFTPASVTLQRCADSDCGLFDQNINTNPIYVYDPVEEKGTLEINYLGNLTENRQYRVILDGAVILSTEGVQIGNLNYDSDTKFSWVFGTKDDPTACAINETRVSPLLADVKIGGTKTYTASAYASPDECSSSGQKLKATDYNWSWTSKNNDIAQIGNLDLDGDPNSYVDPIQVATASPINTGTVKITPTEVASGISATTPATLNVEDDPTSCFDDSECATNELGQACPGSVCLNNHCTPVFLAPPDEFSPDNGPIGTWVTISGCWFGNYVAGKSQVTFNDNKIGKIPDEALCGKSWMNYQIVREVPDEDTPDPLDDAIDGAITVVGGNSGSYTYDPITTSDQFNVDLSAKGPQICALAPLKGKMGTDVTVKGEGFETPRSPAWDVTFFDAPAGRVAVDGADYGTWVDQNIEVKVPSTADSGGVQVDKNGSLSNLYGFEVVPPTCTPCENDGDCTVANQGCGYDGCCHDRPLIISTVPTDGQTDVCLNTKIEMKFNEKMDKSTFTTGAGGTVTMQMQPVPPPIVLPVDIDLTGKITVRDKSLTINLGLLKKRMRYTLNVSGAVRNAQGVTMSIPSSIAFVTADTDAACQISKLELDPDSHTFTDSAQNQNFHANALDSTGNKLTRVPGVYDWTWAWASDDDTIVTITDSDADQQTASPQKNGNTRIRVEAQATTGWEGEKTASAPIRVIFCDMPWLYEDSAANCDVLPASCGDYNFDLFYCQGGLGYCENDPTDNCRYSYTAAGCPGPAEDCCPNVGEKCIFPSGNLPNFDLSVERGTSGDVLKQFLFKESDKCVGTDVSCTIDAQCSIYEPDLTCGPNKDGIGIRIYANPEGLSPRAWYDLNIENPGSPSLTSVDGYEAIRDGRTVYVAAANISGGTVFNNIYLISYNDDAESSTVKIFNQMLKNWRFNTNSGDISQEDKVLLTRDIKRIADLKTIISYLEAYRASHGEVQGSNIAQNPGFEANASTPTSWFDNGVGTYNIVQGEKTEGNQSLKITVPNSVGYTVQDIPVDLGKTYEVSVQVKTDMSANNMAWLLVQCYDSVTPAHDWSTDCGLNGLADVYVQGSHDWTKLSTVVSANKAGRDLRVVLHVVTNIDGGTESAWYDDIQVKEISSPYPSLDAGSYLKNLTTSSWPSWQATLGNALGKSLPSDPIDDLINCPESFSDQSACWNEPTKEFICNPGSHVYAYRSDGISYRLFANLEYSGWPFLSSYNPCNDRAPSRCQCFNHRITGP